MAIDLIDAPQGIDVTYVRPSTDPTPTLPGYKPGLIMLTSVGFVQYVKSGGTVNAGDFVKATQDGVFTATQVNTAGLPTVPQTVGFALATIPNTYFGWHWIGAGQLILGANVATSVSAATQLTSTTTLGQVGTGGTAILGLTSLAASAASGLSSVYATSIMRHIG